MVRGLIVGMLAGLLVALAVLVTVSLLVPLPRSAAPVDAAPPPTAERSQAAAPRPALPQGLGSRAAPPDAVGAPAKATPADPATGADGTDPGAGVTADRASPAPATAPAAPSMEAAQAESEAAAAADRAEDTFARPNREPEPAAPAGALANAPREDVPPASREVGTAARAPADTVGRALSAAPPIAPEAPRPVFAPPTAGTERANPATSALSDPSGPRLESAPARPLRPGAEMRLSELATAPGPMPPAEMLRPGPRLDAAPSAAAQTEASAGSEVAEAENMDAPPSPLAGIDFAARLATSRRLEGEEMSDDFDAAGSERADAAPVPPGEAQPASPDAGTPPRLAGNGRDAPAVGQPVLPLTERTGVRPLPERAPAEGLDMSGARTAAPRADDPAWRRNADRRAVSAGPLLSVVLLDPGLSPGARRLFILRGLPVSVAIDPSRTDAAEAIADYRAAGIEVLLTPGPMTPQEALEGQADVIGLLLPSMSERWLDAAQTEGLGIVLLAGGLDGAAREAVLAGLPGLRIFRDIDAGRERDVVIIRYLTRAGWEAERTGGEIALGRIFPDTLTALAAYTRSDQGLAAPLAPVSALMARQAAEQEAAPRGDTDG